MKICKKHQTFEAIG